MLKCTNQVKDLGVVMDSDLVLISLINVTMSTCYDLNHLLQVCSLSPELEPYKQTLSAFTPLISGTNPQKTADLLTLLLLFDLFNPV